MKTYNYDELVREITTNGAWQNNTRGVSKYISNIDFDGQGFTSLTAIDEVMYFIGIADTLPKRKWWQDDDFLLASYKNLFSGYWQVLDNLKRKSRNTILTNRHTCVSSIFFYFDENEALCCHVVQRSADVSLGLRHDYSSLKWLLGYTCTQLGVEQGSFTYHVINAHIYEENLNKTTGFVKK